MVPETTVKQVLDLLQDCRSERQIAALLGVSRSTVQSIARGQHRHLRQFRAKHARASRVGVRRFGRCGNCGHKVRLPCLICIARRLLKGDLREKRRRLGTSRK